MAEGYILEESITFCSTFLEGVKTTFWGSKRNYDYNVNVSAYLFNYGGRVLRMERTCHLDGNNLKQAHCSSFRSYERTY